MSGALLPVGPQWSEGSLPDGLPEVFGAGPVAEVGPGVVHPDIAVAMKDFHPGRALPDERQGDELVNMDGIGFSSDGEGHLEVPAAGQVRCARGGSSRHRARSCLELILPMADVLDIYDHEVKQVLALMEALNARASSGQHNYSDFEREIRGRFAEAGFTVDVNWYRFSVGGVEQDGAMPEITITGRTDEKFTFDPDRQVHEAVHDVLGLGEEGWIKTDKETLRNFLDGNGGHAHGHGHHH
jgi:hypothetical protein